MDQILNLKKSLMNEEFESIKDIRQRVEYAFERLGSVDEIRSNVAEYLSDLNNKNSKSSEKSRYYRQKGNEYLQHKNFEYALYYYCLAILCAPYPSESVAEEDNELCFAFTARSLTHSEMKTYDNALFDINCALSVIGFSMKFDQRLQIMAHKVNCLCHLRRFDTAITVITSIIELIPCLPIYNNLVKSFIHLKDRIIEEFYNSDSESGSDSGSDKSYTELIEEQLKNLNSYISPALKLCDSEVNGRHYEADQVIPKKNIIIVEKSVVGTIHKEYYRSHCHNCFRNLGYQWWPCRYCRNVVFCDEECAKNDQFHSYECRIIDAIHNLGPTHHIVFRFMLLIGSQEALALRRGIPCETDEGNTKQLVYQKFANLIDHRDKYDLNTKVMSICKSIQMAFIFDNFEKFQSNDSTLSDMKETVALLDENNYKVVVNVFGINESFDDCRPFRGNHIGNAIALRSSFFNHSCSPNTIWVFNGRHITMVTKDDIKCGEELTISYGPRSSDSNSLKERQNILEKRYFFQCKCKECLNEVESLPMDE